MVNVTDISYVRLRAPDLDKMEAFLSDFGMKRAHRTDTRLYMHGTGADRYLHVTELGEPGFVGFAFNAGSREDLERLAQMEDSSDIEEIDTPGGGYRVVMNGPRQLFRWRSSTVSSPVHRRPSKTACRSISDRPTSVRVNSSAMKRRRPTSKDWAMSSYSSRIFQRAGIGISRASAF